MSLLVSSLVVADVNKMRISTMVEEKKTRKIKMEAKRKFEIKN